jgi:uncharacterized membrane protein
MARGDLKRRYLSDEQLARIAAGVAACERGTAGEVRVIVRDRRDWLARLLRFSVRRLALEEFRRLRMHQTRDRTGVILLLLLEDRQFYIYGDKGIHDRVGQSAWDRLSEEMGGIAGREGLYAAVAHGLEQIGALLRQHFPRRPGDVNELSDEVALR